MSPAPISMQSSLLKGVQLHRRLMLLRIDAGLYNVPNGLQQTSKL